MLKIFYLCVFLCGCGKDFSQTHKNQSTSKLNGVSHTLLLKTPLSRDIELLPLKGQVLKTKKLWSGDSWPLNRGAINFRWNSPLKESFNYLSPTTRELQNIPLDTLKRLSPAEKYDLYLGRYDYPLKYEVDILARTGGHNWEGLCHGWAAATLNHESPQEKILLNPDGLEIPFGSSDIKALLSYAYSKIILSSDQTLGKRCETNGLFEDHCDNDLTALNFHLVLTNRLGLRGESFVADIERFKEVWNHPISAYTSTIIKKNRNSVTFRTTLTYLDLIKENSWKETPNIFSYLTVEYELDLNRKGQLTKGRWLSEARPDFLWITEDEEVFTGYFEKMKNLVSK